MINLILIALGSHYAINGESLIIQICGLIAVVFGSTYSGYNAAKKFK
ncbi:Uncharacterised protein [uncultured Clostridium sp.]|nr:Uncharacterised protein [uncultured Clostridium sp.]